ncbi:hypothetical protein SEA_PINKCREEK_181 [Mycobacterium phage Pinkcreek]|nr:hypothetical protein SEA_PINKCREEK_181 [Mycobacterium phage Pinkcreek]
MTLPRDPRYSPGHLVPLSSEPPFYWQRAHLDKLDGPVQSFDVRDVLYGMMAGLSARDAHELARAAQETRARHRRAEGNWDLWDWVDLLQKLSYKPGWHCQILLGHPTPRIEIETVVTLPDGATERLVSSVLLYENMPGARWARRAITAMLQEMEVKIMKAYLRCDGEPWTEEKDVP